MYEGGVGVVVLVVVVVVFVFMEETACVVAVGVVGSVM